MDQVLDKILIVDDDPAVQAALEKVVLDNAMEPLVVSSGEAALETLSSKSFDLIIMDVNMPGISGFEAVQEIRKRGITTPIIIVSGRKEDFDTLYGLDIGADDYITKPFNPVTLGAKAKALIRRSKGSAAIDEIKVGPFTYETSTLRFFKNGEEIVLSGKENAMMKLFMDNANKIFTKETIYEMIWGNNLVDESAIIVYINRLRTKIEDNPQDPQYIRTVRGLGYKFVV